MSLRSAAALAVVAAVSSAAFAEPRIAAHAIDARLDPATGRIEADDVLTVVREGGGALEFTLNAALEITAVVGPRPDTSPASANRVAHDGWVSKWRIDIPADGPAELTVLVRYAGTISDPVEKSGTLGFVVGDDTRGVICAEGAYLSEGSGWYPAGSGMARFDVRATVPEPYSVVTQGTRSESGEWKGKYDADGLSLVAGKWKHEERRTSAGVVVGTWLGESNAAHAKLLLDAAEKYLALYSDLLGPYAYDRFDIVQNWFTTGYGMPEFTLLGGDVIARMAAESQRTGAIPAGYLDHEIVHSWWGNLVFPYYASGNWCEGLTSYCANYFSKEAANPEEAREYRRRTVVRFTIRATPERDYPVRRFRGKTEDVDDDIGYGKCSMLFHALRRSIGDDAFWATLRRVAKEQRGRRFAWADWQREFEKSSKRNLGEFFAQALDRTGAPLFSVADVSVAADGGRLRVSGTLKQAVTEAAPAWRTTVPVVVEHLAGREEALVECSTEATRFSVLVPSLPLRVTADPDFHVFRRLAADEVPPCLASMLARPTKFMVYPDDDAPLAAAAEMAAHRAGGTALPASKAPAAPEPGASYLVFGDAARVPLLASLRTKLPRHFPGARATDATAVLATGRNPADPGEFVTTLVGSPAAVADRARSVYYYQYDGRIVFEGRAPRERGVVAAANHASRTLLPDVQTAASPADARALVDRLAAPEMRGRLAGTPEDKATRATLVAEFTMAGLEVDEQPFSFVVKSAPRVALACGDAVVPDVLALTASPTTGESPLALAGIAADPEEDLTGRALLLDLPAGQDDLVATLRSTAELAKARGASALLVRRPAEPSKAMQDLWLFAGEEVPGHRAAGVAARTGGDRDLALPTVAVPHDFDAKRPATSLAVAFTATEVRTANVTARVKANAKQRRPGVVVLGAHHDHLGDGFPGGDDNASGVAALIGAARILATHADLLGRDVVLVSFGAEEWGLRGSRAFLAAWPKDRPVVAMVNADTVGRRGVHEASVVGVSKHPRLAQVVAAALEQAFVGVGPDIDRHAFAWGSDHFAFHEAGIPAVDLWSGDYAVMHTKEDTADGVDEAKVARIGRALAIAALGVAGGF